MEKRVDRLTRKKNRVRGKFPKEGYRLSVYRSNKYIAGQVIDQKNGKTVFGLSEKSKEVKALKGKTKTEKAKEFGIIFGQKVKANKIEKVVFDRGVYRYHGRVKAFADGAREGGLSF